MTQDEEMLVSALVRGVDIQRASSPRHAESVANASQDADDVAAYVAGAMSVTERERFERRLATDDNLRAIWSAVRAEGGTEHASSASGKPSEGRRLLFPILAIAAAILVGLGLWQLKESPKRATNGDTATATAPAALLARVDELRSRGVTWIGALPHLADGDPTPERGPVYRDGLRLHGPRGRILSTDKPLGFWFQAPPGSDALTIRVEEDASGHRSAHAIASIKSLVVALRRTRLETGYTLPLADRGQVRWPGE